MRRSGGLSGQKNERKGTYEVLEEKEETQFNQMCTEIATIRGLPQHPGAEVNESTTGRGVNIRLGSCG